MCTYILQHINFGILMQLLKKLLIFDLKWFGYETVPYAYNYSLSLGPYRSYSVGQAHITKQRRLTHMVF